MQGDLGKKKTCSVEDDEDMTGRKSRGAEDDKDMTDPIPDPKTDDAASTVAHQTDEPEEVDIPILAADETQESGEKRKFDSPTGEDQVYEELDP